MRFAADTLYHIYNQGNNKETVFYSADDYLDFLRLYRKEVAPHCETLCYCLMPNHFHFLIYASEKSAEEFKLGGLIIQKLSDGYRRLLSTYSTRLNKKLDRSGALFRPKTKAKEIDEEQNKSLINYGELCFHYIHQNPVRANLVKREADWKFSSYLDYSGERQGTLCNKAFAHTYFGWKENEFKSPNDLIALKKEDSTKLFVL